MVETPSGPVYVEYFGMMTSEHYAARANRKLEAGRRLGLDIVALYPCDDVLGALREALAARQLLGS